MSRTRITRELLVETARTLFWKHGYEATSVAQILEGAQAGSGSLYYFFSSKEDLLMAVLEWYKSALHEIVVEPVFARVNDPVERIFGILEGYRHQLVETNFEHGCPVGSLALELSNRLPAARQLVADNFAAWCAVIRSCLDELRERFPPDIDTRQMSEFVLTTMEGAVMLARTYRSISPYEAALAQLRSYFRYLLGERSVSHEPAESISSPPAIKEN